MSKIQIEGHPSLIIVYSEECKGEVILGGYDGGYSRLAYKSRPNLLGGNPLRQDKENGPRDILIRELTEELEINPCDLNSEWAPKEDILEIRREIIKNTEPYLDFLYQAIPLEGAVREKITAIYSIFISKVPKRTADLIRLHFQNGKKMTTEGFIGIYHIKSLAIAGEYSTANATAKILSEYFKIDIPSLDAIKITKLGAPREKYSDYYKDYIYADSAWGRE